MRGPGRIAVPLICVAFTALGIVLIVAGEPVIGGACVLFFGLGAGGLLPAVRRRRDPQPARSIVFDGEPALLFPLGRARQALAGLGSAGLVTTASNEVLAVRARDPALVRSGRFARFNRRFGPAEIMIPALQMSGRPEEALRTLELCLANPRARARLGTT